MGVLNLALLFICSMFCFLVHILDITNEGITLLPVTPYPIKNISMYINKNVDRVNNWVPFDDIQFDLTDFTLSFAEELPLTYYFAYKLTNTNEEDGFTPAIYRYSDGSFEQVPILNNVYLVSADQETDKIEFMNRKITKINGVNDIVKKIWWVIILYLFI